MTQIILQLLCVMHVLYGAGKNVPCLAHETTTLNVCMYIQCIYVYYECMAELLYEYNNEFPVWCIEVVTILVYFKRVDSLHVHVHYNAGGCYRPYNS